MNWPFRQGQLHTLYTFVKLSFLNRIASAFKLLLGDYVFYGIVSMMTEALLRIKLFETEINKLVYIYTVVSR
jgi:hypothetical protein